MAYFQESESEKVHYAVEGSAAFAPTPPASADPRQANSNWTFPSAQQHNFLDTSWSASIPELYGLGLSAAADPANITRQAHYADPTLNAASIPFSWPSELAVSYQSYPGLVGPASTSRTEAASSWSTVSPAATVWRPTAAPVYNPSPSLSSFSASPRPSTISSPYAHSEEYSRPPGSPRIKVEEIQERTMSLNNALPEDPYLDQAFVLRSNDPQMHLPSSYYDAAPSASFPVEDSKSTLRPPTRRAFSCEDVRAGMRQDGAKRGYTKPEEAQCSCEVCGKLFQRSYNLKAHMETHDPRRSQPHICQYAGCEKRFVRRTDLLRHEQSVHLKTRDFICPLCGVSFARRDTLRRHVDDGCPLRPEMKRRNAKPRRASCVPSSRRRSSQQSQSGDFKLPLSRQP